MITGGYAVQAHELLARPSQDLDVATDNPAPMDEIVHTLTDGLTGPTLARSEPLLAAPAIAAAAST
ncbi:hypothetical protein [Streptomyces coriariae]|uniref:hypothetical protein n=1 Tax=Streptomyces coriariae TaxID=2864460 RepID=UPI001E5E4BD7|nr:hypothetical protein [Streptomyces coriariae]